MIFPLDGAIPYEYMRRMKANPIIRFELHLTAEKWQQIDAWRRQLPRPSSKAAAVRLLIDTALATPAAQELLAESAKRVRR